MPEMLFSFLFSRPFAFLWNIERKKFSTLSVYYSKLSLVPFDGSDQPSWLANPSGFLSCNEQKDLELRSRPSAISEFVATRWIAKNLAHRILPAYHWSDWEISKEPNGKPILRLHSDQSMELSLSHKYPWIAVAISLDQRVGIDIERTPDFKNEDKKRSWMNSILSLGFTDEEKATISNLDVDELLLRWTMKEAIAKATGHVGLSGMRQVNTSRIETDDVQGIHRKLEHLGTQFAIDTIHIDSDSVLTIASEIETVASRGFTGPTECDPSKFKST